MDQKEPTGSNGENPPESIQSTTSLGILLIGFLGIFIMALLIIMTGKSVPEGEGRVAYRPADFPAVFNVDPVEGLASLTAGHGPITVANSGEAKLFDVARPPLSEGIFPCSSCHEGMEPNETVRQVGDPHAEIVLNHGDPKDRWCLDCHNPKNRDQLRLANGKTISFEESHRLCGQCHGNVYRDWKIGIHGKRVGYWNGPKIYLLCVHCHNPHSPRYKPLKPLPPPVRPDFQRAILTENLPLTASGAVEGRK